MLEAVESLARSKNRRQRSARLMLADMREQLRDGESFSQIMRRHPAWFDPTETAIAESGQHSGNLSEVLTVLAERHEEADRLSHKLAATLAYPLIVLVIGVGVALFLSVKTLPDLAKILQDARIAVPPLTTTIMALGQGLMRYWYLCVLLVVVLCLTMLSAPLMLQRIAERWAVPEWIIRAFTWSIPVLRTIAMSNVALRLSELLHSGVPMTDALRIVAPTVREMGLRQQLALAAERVERGDELSSALCDERWFNSEFARLLELGQASGDLDRMLNRIGHRYQRQARRHLDRLATILEPTVILVLAVFVGTVVMAAILPLIRLKEVLQL